MTETARLHSFHVADMLDAGENPVMETAIAKTLATEYNLWVADMAMQVMESAGYMMGPIARLYADARSGPDRRQIERDYAQRYREADPDVGATERHIAAHSSTGSG